MSLKDLARAEQRADGDGQHVDQFVILGAIDARVGQVLEVCDQTEFGVDFASPV